MRVRALVWLRGLSWFDGERVTDEEQIAALRLSARSLVTQQAILARSTTDRLPVPVPVPALRVCSLCALSSYEYCVALQRSGRARFRCRRTRS